MAANATPRWRLPAVAVAAAGLLVLGPAGPAEASTGGAAALRLGLVSTPAGGAYEWQYFAAGVDRVPTGVVSAARRVTIAVVDTGADLTAPGLRGKVVGSYDVRTGSRNVVDRSGHGTFVASLAGGETTGAGGISGFGGAARLLIVKVGDSTTVSDVNVAAGILYAVRHGARIVNVSIAGRARSPVEADALEYAARRGVLVIAAAGNDGLAGNPPEYPAARLQPPGSNGAGGIGLSVAASDFAGARASFSESGSFVSLAAPGTSVFGMVSSQSMPSLFPRVTLPGASAGLYGFASGTSFAAAQVSGAAALVWAADPRLSFRQVANILERTASGGGSWRPDLGFGVVDVGAAVEAALGMEASPGSIRS